MQEGTEARRRKKGECGNAVAVGDFAEEKRPPHLEKRGAKEDRIVRESYYAEKTLVPVGLNRG